MVTTKLTTVEDVERLPDDGYQYELLRGVLFRMSPSGIEHSHLGFLVSLHLGGFVEEHDLGWVTGADGGYILARDPDILLAPDVAFIRKDRLPPKRDRPKFSQVPPDLVVEIRSPSDTGPDVIDKVNAYLEAGVPLVWFIEPARLGARVFRPGRAPRELGLDDDLDGEDILPGFRLPLANVFRDLIEE